MKYKKKLSAAILSLLIFIISNSYAQSSAVPSPNIISPSPTSSSLGKFGEIPVSLYTGTTNISIPIHTISNGSLKMPVNINYHTSGIKVGEEASWVGLGWSLNAGGVINRSIRGLSDLNENQEYYNLHTGFPDVKMIENADPITGDYNQPEDNNAHLYTGLFRDIYYGKVDTEPDVFYFNFLGYSGKFYIKKRETVNDEYEFLIESKEKMKIRIFDQGNFSYRWEITVADGTVFTFSTAEKAKISNWKTVSSVDSFFTKTPKPGFDPIHTLTWYLDGIQTASGDNVSFEYTTPLIHGTRKVTSFTQTVSQKIYQIGSNVHCPSPEFEYDYLYASSSLNYDVYLKKIYSANETIEFIHSDRIDIAPESPGSYAKKLDKIIIYNKNNVIDQFEFSYDYFNATSTEYLSYDRTYSSKRLRLLSIKKRNSQNAVQPLYSFEYDNEMADKYSTGQDHWGYYNGKNNSSVYMPLNGYPDFRFSLIPPLKLPPPSGINPASHSGADRETDENFAKMGMLKKVYYPTGGSSTFNYESNDYYEYGEVQSTNNIKDVFMFGAEVIDPLADPFILDYHHLPNQEFFTLTESTSVTLSANIQLPYNHQCNEFDLISNYIALYITKVNTATVQAGLSFDITECDISHSKQLTVTLGPGSYTVSANATGKYICLGSVIWTSETTQTNYFKKGGGVRISSIVENSGLNNENLIKYYSYKINDQVERSSGLLLSPVKNEHIDQHLLTVTCGTDIDIISEHINVGLLKRTSESKVPMGSSSQGSPIGYSQVTVTDNNGKIIYKFINEKDEYTADYPGIPNLSNLSNGLLLEENYYSQDEKLLKTIKKSYAKGGQTEVLKSFKLFGFEYLYQILEGSPYDYVHGVKIATCRQKSEWWHPVSEIVTINENDKLLSETTDYLYDNSEHLQMTKKIEYQNLMDKNITEYRYPSDFSAINGFIPELLDAHIHNIPIETTISKEENGIKKYVGSVFNEYAKNNKGILPIRTYILELDKPISNFISSASTINGLPIDANYKISNQYYYNPNSNQPYMVEDRLTKTIYLWGYNNQYPVAKVIGSDYNTVITRISQLNIDNATALNNNDVAVRALLDGLRTSFASDPLVQVTTYTYSPLIGMTSETSPDGRTIYYEYDGFGRLKLIKDDEGKVLKKICYNYQGQQVDCN